MYFQSYETHKIAEYQNNPIFFLAHTVDDITVGKVFFCKKSHVDSSLVLKHPRAQAVKVIDKQNSEQITSVELY